MSSCKVANRNCQASANLGGKARFTCWRCGESVCGECSNVIPWGGSPRKKRICDDCLEESRQEARRTHDQPQLVPTPAAPVARLAFLAHALFCRRWDPSWKRYRDGCQVSVSADWPYESDAAPSTWYVEPPTSWRLCERGQQLLEAAQREAVEAGDLDPPEGADHGG